MRKRLLDKGINASIGAICMLSGVILYGFVHLAKGSYRFDLHSFFNYRITHDFNQNKAFIVLYVPRY